MNKDELAAYGISAFCTCGERGGGIADFMYDEAKTHLAANPTHHMMLALVFYPEGERWAPVSEIQISTS